jgi:hypothetical protein
MTVSIPYSAAEITPEWLTRVLREGGHIGDARVLSFGQETIGEGVGFLGELTRLTLHYDKSVPGAPASIISKMPTAFAPARDIGNAFRFFEREGRFYTDIAPEVKTRVPRCYGSVVDVAADRYVLLLEDIQGASVGDQLLGCTLEQAEIVIREAAGFHATWWDNPQLQRFASWMPTMADPMYDYLAPLWEQSWPAFLEFQAEDYPREKITPVANRALAAMQATRAKVGALPQSIVHSDFRLDNMFFGDPKGETPFALIDWQLTLRGSPLLDIGYFLSQSLDIGLRRANEDRLLRDYHAILVDNGVRNYSFEQCWDEYRFGVIAMFVIPVTGAANLDSSNPRAVPLIRAMAERSTAAILDLDAAATLPV